MKVILWWTWYASCVAVGAFGLFTMIVGDLGAQTILGMTFSGNARSAIYAFMLVDGGWRIYSRLNFEN